MAQASARLEEADNTKAAAALQRELLGPEPNYKTKGPRVVSIFYSYIKYSFSNFSTRIKKLKSMLPSILHGFRVNPAPILWFMPKSKDSACRRWKLPISSPTLSVLQNCLKKIWTRFIIVLQV